MRAIILGGIACFLFAADSWADCKQLAKLPFPEDPAVVACEDRVFRIGLLKKIAAGDSGSPAPAWNDEAIYHHRIVGATGEMWAAVSEGVRLAVAAAGDGVWLFAGYLKGYKLSALEAENPPASLRAHARSLDRYLEVLAVDQILPLERTPGVLLIDRPMEFFDTLQLTVTVENMSQDVLFDSILSVNPPPSYGISHIEMSTGDGRDPFNSGRIENAGYMPGERRQYRVQMNWRSSGYSPGSEQSAITVTFVGVTSARPDQRLTGAVYDKATLHYRLRWVATEAEDLVKNAGEDSAQ